MTRGGKSSELPWILLAKFIESPVLFLAGFHIYIYRYIYIYLVSGFKHVLNFPFHIWDIYIYTYSLYPFSILGETSSVYMFYMFTASFLMAWKRSPPSFDW